MDVVLCHPEVIFIMHSQQENPGIDIVMSVARVSIEPEIVPTSTNQGRLLDSIGLCLSVEELCTPLLAGDQLTEWNLQEKRQNKTPAWRNRTRSP